MTTDRSKFNEEEEINVDIAALENIITVLQVRNNSLTVAIEKILSVPTNLNIAESM